MESIREMTIHKGSEIELTVESVSFGGQGIARVNDFVVFVNGGITGDRVLAKIIKKKKSFAEAQAISVLTPSTNRIKPECELFGICGGCSWQDVAYDTQLEFKRQNVQEVFERIGGFKDIHIPKPIGSKDIYHYRNKMEFTFGDRPWLTASQLSDINQQFEPFALGLHVPQRFDKVLPVHHCHLQSKLANEILNFVKHFTRNSGLRPYSVKNHSGFWRFLVIRQSKRTDDLMINLITSEEQPDIIKEFKDQILLQFPQITSLINGISSKKAQVAFSDYEILLHGSPFIIEKLGDFEFEISSNAFFQTNTLAAEKLYQVALEFADLKGHELVYDLYCGTGSISIFISKSAKKVIGIELIEAAVENAQKNIKHNRITNCEFLLGDLRKTINQLHQTPDVVIVDPPRSGMHEDVINSLLELAPPTIVYVSCNPSTQARDLALLCKQYRIEKIQPVDMFPHTYHIENVVRLVKA
ncbi:23S rRNA (uracil(1939)-C(5))-methyltransferase RlmD [bacterium]|nr:23S rRNA (uracil(1939)-C(5))-methyltransferase RlmD [bacterium]